MRRSMSEFESENFNIEKRKTRQPYKFLWNIREHSAKRLTGWNIKTKPLSLNNLTVRETG